MKQVGAVILAAGMAKRMGRSKLDLDWKDGGTIVGHVVSTFVAGGANPIIVVSGDHRESVEASLIDAPVELTYNPEYQAGGMLSSIRVGLVSMMESEAEAALVMPGDLPFLQSTTIKELVRIWHRDQKPILAPSFEMRRGHPVLLAREIWPEVIEEGPWSSLRDMLEHHQVVHIDVGDLGIRRDIDTDEDYQQGLSLIEGE